MRIGSEIPSRLKGIETDWVSKGQPSHPQRSEIPSRLKGIETFCLFRFQCPFFRSEIPSRLKGIETLLAVGNQQSEFGNAFLFEGD